MPNFCISTTTAGQALYVNGDALKAVTDSAGWPYMATTSCPSVIEYVVHQVDNPAQNLYNGIILLLVVSGFIVWYFLARFKLS